MGSCLAAATADLVLRALARWPAGGRTVLEVNCGTGLLQQTLRGMGLDVTGCEPSPALRELFAAQLGYTYVVDPAHADLLPYGDKSFDWVVVHLEYTGRANLEQTLQEARRVALCGVAVLVWNTLPLLRRKGFAKGPMQPCSALAVYKALRAWQAGVLRVHGRFFFPSLPCSFPCTPPAGETSAGPSAETPSPKTGPDDRAEARAGSTADRPDPAPGSQTPAGPQTGSQTPPDQPAGRTGGEDSAGGAGSRTGCRTGNTAGSSASEGPVQTFAPGSCRMLCRAWDWLCEHVPAGLAGHLVLLRVDFPPPRPLTARPLRFARLKFASNSGFAQGCSERRSLARDAEHCLAQGPGLCPAQGAGQRPDLPDPGPVRMPGQGPAMRSGQGSGQRSAGRLAHDPDANPDATPGRNRTLCTQK